MKKITLFILLLSAATIIYAQEQKPKLYNPHADARLEIDESVQQARDNGKHVLIMVGGNW